MITDQCQRFTLGRESRRPAGELINPSEYDVAFIGDNDTAVEFIRAHHYIKRPSPPAHRIGLYRFGNLVGVALFGPPASVNAHHKVWGHTSLTFKTAVTWGRLVLTDEVPGNGESWFGKRCFRLLRGRGVVAVESCADPWPRTDEYGRVTFKGHIGTIYKALNGQFVGKTNPSTIHLLPDGTVLSNRTEGKARNGEQRGDDAISQLVSQGADRPADGEDVDRWLDVWRPRLCRNMRHRGNYRYIFSIDKRHRREVLAGQPDLDYPKFNQTELFS